MIAAQGPRIEEHYLCIMFGLGVMILIVAWLPILLKRLPLSLPMICVAIGAAVLPFIHLACAVATAGGVYANVLQMWLLEDVVWKLGACMTSSTKPSACC